MSIHQLWWYWFLISVILFWNTFPKCAFDQIKCIIWNSRDFAYSVSSVSKHNSPFLYILLCSIPMHRESPMGKRPNKIMKKSDKQVFCIYIKTDLNISNVHRWCKYFIEHFVMWTQPLVLRCSGVWCIIKSDCKDLLNLIHCLCIWL